jgi:ABC-type antimicrobial peptide transport system permease subunit
MALGAQRASVLWLVLREAIVLAVVGTVIGVSAARAVTGLVANILFGVKLTDPLTYSLAALLMVAVATLASYLPARRASRIDPMVVLRYQ